MRLLLRCEVKRRIALILRALFMCNFISSISWLFNCSSEMVKSIKVTVILSWQSQFDRHYRRRCRRRRRHHRLNHLSSYTFSSRSCSFSLCLTNKQLKRIQETNRPSYFFCIQICSCVAFDDANQHWISQLKRRLFTTQNESNITCMW